MQSLQTSPRPNVSKARDPRSVDLSRRADGSFGALSSNGRDIYHVTVTPASCQCRGFAARQTCCHLLAAQAAEVRCASCGTSIPQSEAHRSASPYGGWNHDSYETCEAFRGNARRQRGAW